MNDDVKETIDQLANSLQTVTLLSTQLRRELGNSAKQAVVLAAAADRAVNSAAPVVSDAELAFAASRNTADVDTALEQI